jgi:hypothetical protein
MRIGKAILLGAIVCLVVPASASAGLRITPTGLVPFHSAVGVSSPPQSFTVTAICSSGLSGVCLSPDQTTVAPSITPSLRGNFTQTNNCPVTLTGTSTSGGPSCTIWVTFTPVDAGYSSATLEAGTGSDGPAFATLTGTVTVAGAASKNGKKKCAKRKRQGGKSTRKCRRHKRR